MTQYICTCKADAPSSNMLSKLESAVDDMVDQLNNATNVSTDFGTYHSGHSITEDTSEFSTENEWLEYVGEQVEQNAAALDGDSWIVVDSITCYGYGRGNHTYTWGGDNSIKTARVLDILEDNPSGDSTSTFKGLAIQEVGHGFGAAHKHGKYNYTIDDLVGSNVSPMATAYAYTNSDNLENVSYVDTVFQGGATPPDHFEDEDGNETFDNYFVDEWYGGTASEGRHTTFMSHGTTEVVDRNTPL